MVPTCSFNHHGYLQLALSPLEQIFFKGKWEVSRDHSLCNALMLIVLCTTVCQKEFVHSVVFWARFFFLLCSCIYLTKQLLSSFGVRIDPQMESLISSHAILPDTSRRRPRRGTTSLFGGGGVAGGIRAARRPGRADTDRGRILHPAHARCPSSAGTDSSSDDDALRAKQTRVC